MARQRCGAGHSGGMWRSFDVGAVVASLPFGDNHVAAGGGGMVRRVRRARLAARPEDLRRVGAHELVITTAATLAATGEEWERLVARLDAGQVAGIAVRLDAADQLPAALLAAADRLSLPVIAFSDGAPLADVTASVLDALLDAQGQRLERVLDIHQRFTRIVAAGGGTVEIATTLQTLLGVPVAIVDGDGRPMVVVPSDTAGSLNDTITSGEGRRSRPAITTTVRSSP